LKRRQQQWPAPSPPSRSRQSFTVKSESVTESTHRFTTHSPTKAVYSSHNNRLFIIISSLSLRRYMNDTVSSLKIEHNNIHNTYENTKYESLCNDWCHSCIGQLHKSHWTPPHRQSFSFSKSTSSRPPVIYFGSQSYSFM